MSEVKKKVTKKAERNFEVELMEEKIKSLEAKVTKPQTSEEAFQERLVKYEAGQPRRDALKAEIQERRRVMQEKYPKARYEEIKTLEAWDRRSDMLKDKDMNASIKLRNEFIRRVNQIQKDPTR